MSGASLEERLARLEAVRAIADLKSRYARLADEKYTSGHERVAEARWRDVAALQAACFTDDARWHGGEQFGGTLTGRVELTAFFERSPWRFALHYYVSPAIAIHSETMAEATWRLWQLGLPLDAQAPVLLAGSTIETYRRTGGEWLIESMRFTEIHTVDLSAAPAALRCVLSRSDA